MLLGTTDTPRADVPVEPRPLPGEIDFILRTAASCLAGPGRRDVLSVFAGLRPLISAAPGEPTGRLSREHVIRTSPSGLVTIGGGKWTTYRRMAEEVIDRAVKLAGLASRPCETAELRLVMPRATAGASAPLHPRLDIDRARVETAVRFEFARNLEDVLARRHRGLFLDAGAALEVAPEVAAILAATLGHDAAWAHAQCDRFGVLAQAYRIEAQAE